MKNFEISSLCGAMISTVKVNEEEILKDIQTSEEIKNRYPNWRLIKASYII